MSRARARSARGRLRTECGCPRSWNGHVTRMGSHRAGAGRGPAFRAPVLVAGRGVAQVDLEEVRQRGQPREHIGELELQVGPLARADRTSELPELLGEPPKGRIDTSGLISRQIGVAHQRLQRLDLHSASVAMGAILGRCGGRFQTTVRAPGERPKAAEGYRCRRWKTGVKGGLSTAVWQRFPPKEGFTVG